MLAFLARSEKTAYYSVSMHVVSRWKKLWSKHQFFMTSQNDNVLLIAILGRQSDRRSCLSNFSVAMWFYFDFLLSFFQLNFHLLETFLMQDAALRLGR